MTTLFWVGILNLIYMLFVAIKIHKASDHFLLELSKKVLNDKISLSFQVDRGLAFFLLLKKEVRDVISSDTNLIFLEKK